METPLSSVYPRWATPPPGCDLEVGASLPHCLPFVLRELSLATLWVPEIVWQLHQTQTDWTGEMTRLLLVQKTQVQPPSIRKAAHKCL